MSREDIEEAIEVLEDASAEMLTETGEENYYCEAIAILRQALEAEQEPVAWLKTWSDGSLTVLKTKSHAFADHELEPLYTAPPKREWVSLTDEEIDALSQARSLTDELMDCVEACTTWCGLCGRNPWHRNQP
jgi:hypothetical protein